MRFSAHLWVTLLVALFVPFAGAAPSPITGRDLLGSVVNNVVSTIIGGLADTFAGSGSLFTVDTYISPSNAGGKKFKVTGGRWLGYNSWIGIPYGEPVTGTKRFDRPTPKVYTKDFAALAFGKACIQPKAILDGAVGQSEDCLNLNVITPEGASKNPGKLPVMVWIFGGGFSGGGASYYSALVAKVLDQSKKMGTPVIHVALNYRLGVYGWGLGKEFAAEGLGNNGLRDQRLAIQWVRENIANFGGDPNQITLYGESAGAISTHLHLLDENNSNGLAGAIMQSGSASSVPISPTGEWQDPFDDLANLLNCGDAPNKLDCLRSVSADDLRAAQDKVYDMEKYSQGSISAVWRPSIDGDLVKGSPYQLISQGRWAKIPVITGTNKDEGTLLINADIKTQDQVVADMQKAGPRKFTAASVSKVLAAYPNDPSLGCPFDTGTKTFGKTVAFKQMAAIFTDACFVAKRRQFVRTVNQQGFKNTWVYTFEGTIPILPAYYGSTHAIEIAYTYGVVAPLLLFWSLPDQTMSTQMMKYWINFAVKRDPNGSGLPTWSTHDFPSNKNSMWFKPGKVGIIQDDYREDRVAVFSDPEVAAEFQA